MRPLDGLLYLVHAVDSLSGLGCDSVAPLLNLEPRSRHLVVASVNPKTLARLASGGFSGIHTF
jgi:hypothetical protein